MSSLLLSPHNDDETLFAAYTIIREKPLVAICTDSWIQPNRGDVGCSAEDRWAETRAACKILGCEPVRLGIRDHNLTEEELKEKFEELRGYKRVYIPALQGGNWQHDLVNKVAKIHFHEEGAEVIEYTTYTKTELWTKGNTEVIPTEEEKALKLKALACYTSQINLPSTRPHFEAVINKSEWLIP